MSFSDGQKALPKDTEYSEGKVHYYYKGLEELLERRSRREMALIKFWQRLCGMAMREGAFRLNRRHHYHPLLDRSTTLPPTLMRLQLSGALENIQS